MLHLSRRGRAPSCQAWQHGLTGRQMDRTDVDYEDGFVLDVISPTNRTVVVRTNTSPLAGSFVTGSSGEGFINLSNYSWVVEVSNKDRDMIAKVELPWDPVALQQQNVDRANTFVGRLSRDGRSWWVSEDQRNVHM